MKKNPAMPGSRKEVIKFARWPMRLFLLLVRFGWLIALVLLRGRGGSILAGGLGGFIGIALRIVHSISFLKMSENIFRHMGFILKNTIGLIILFNIREKQQ
jgi:hypothetical protein